MYRVGPKQTNLLPDITRADYIQPLDYWRPIVGGFAVGVVYVWFVTAICILSDLSRAHIAMVVGSNGALFAGILYAWVGFMCAICFHGTWKCRLKTLGAQAYRRSISVQIPSRQAMELCLAAASQIKGQRITAFDEEKKHIRVHHKTPWWSDINANVDIVLHESIDGVTHVSMSCHKDFPASRLQWLRLIWGPKWLPLVLSVGNDKLNERLMDQIADYINAHPNWNYQHTFSRVDEDDETPAITEMSA